MEKRWKFSDEPMTACFVESSVLNGSPILRVVHDFDGDWQFHGDGDSTTEPKIVALEVIVKRDPTVHELHDLPYGWAAERNTPSTPWMRCRNNEYPEFQQNGFYLEDAVWVSMSIEDIQTPEEVDLLELDEGDVVKLLFRFAAENAPRSDGQVERMWVEIVGFDAFGDFVGTIANEPLHAAAKYGDEVHFHSRHIAEIGEFS
jgi:hypothetical protein